MKDLLIDFFSIPAKKQSKKRVWYYQHAGEDIQQIVKEDGYYYYQSPKNIGGGSTGCDTLAGAKGDLLLIQGTRVWSELI